MDVLKEFPKELTLKDGRPVVLRPMEANDREVLLQFFRELPEGDRRYLRDDVAKEETIDKWISNLNYRKVLPLLALYENKVVADGTLHRSEYAWDSHVGEIRIVVHPSFRRSGLGSAIARELFQIALKEGLDKIIARMMADDEGAVKVFEKLGFKKEAVLKEHVKDRRGVKHDLLIMSNNVSKLLERLKHLEEDTVRAQDGI